MRAELATVVSMVASPGPGGLPSVGATVTLAFPRARGGASRRARGGRWVPHSLPATGEQWSRCVGCDRFGGTGRRRARARSPTRYPSLPDQVIEVAVPRPKDEGGDLVPGVDQRRTVRVPGVPHGDLPAGHLAEFHAVPARVAAAALAPDDLRQLRRRHAILSGTHLNLSLRAVRTGL